VVFVGREAIVRLYTGNEAIVATALPLLAWVGVFHFVDAMQIVAAFVLRAWRVTALPVLIYTASIWGLGMGGGYLLAFDVGGWVPPALHGARGYWIASTLGLGVAAASLTLLLVWILRQQRRESAAESPQAAAD